MVKIAINGFGRIGRAVFKSLIEKHKNLQIAAINDLTDTKTLAHLLKYDTIYHRWDKEIGFDKSNIIVNNKKYKVLAERDPSELPWKELGVSIVLECTGLFRTKELCEKHLKAGAKKVIISAPAKSDDVPVYVLGVNDKKIKKTDKIISNASCTTNCIAPIVEVLNRKIGIKKVMMTTIHSYTSDQNLVDGPHKDLRRARAAGQNIIPTTTGAALATIKTVPKLKGKFDGISIRVPTALVSMSDFVFLLKKKTDEKKVNKIFVQEKKSKRYLGIIDTTDQPLVSSDFIHNSYSTIIDLSMTKVVDGDFLKVVAWYDNEWGYSNRLAEITELISKINK
ncbi:MAG: type I glyceraldehyde-3-phosphate dehydrogenase [Xanthomonadaceae bacterium]|nr:type I glyceraldehyde-3-phosphate dehydrogenase [Rhodospirillaceae bacterium]NIA17602.1 type I glyceraldehyde-3-phosphate dehydrogenase [Xanthomonadaceae bacterium]